MSSLNQYSTSTAILLFAQSEDLESRVKPIASNSRQNKLLWTKLNNHALKTIKKTKLPFYISNEHNQIGSTFGEKITAAIESVFAKGFEKVIIVGNDCVELTSQHLINAERVLQNSEVVIGPDNSGGAYLIGITKSGFDTFEFESIPWQTNHVFSALQKLYDQQTISTFPALNDFNCYSEFKKSIDRLTFSSSFKKIVVSFLNVPKIHVKSEKYFIQDYLQSLSFNKGSPHLQDNF